MGYDLESRVADLEKSHATQSSDIKYLGEKIGEVKELCQKIDNRFVDNGKPGLITRIDRLEQAVGPDFVKRFDRMEEKEKIRSKLVWALVIVVVGLIAKPWVIDIAGKVWKSDQNISAR